MKLFGSMCRESVKEFYSLDTENADQNNTKSMTKYLMKCREVGDKVGENSRNPRYKICMYQANASDTNNTQ